MTHRKRGLVAGILFLAVALTPVAAVSGDLEDAFEAAMDAKPDAARRDAPDEVETGEGKTLTPVAALAGPFEDGRDAFYNGDYATALRLWRPLAEQGGRAGRLRVPLRLGC